MIQSLWFLRACATSLALAGALVGLTVLLGDSVRRFTATIPQYQGRLEALVENSVALLTRWNVAPPSLEETANFVDPGALLNAVGQTLSAVLTILSRLFVVVIFTAFILLEASELEALILFLSHLGLPWIVYADWNVKLVSCSKASGSRSR